MKHLIVLFVAAIIGCVSANAKGGTAKKYAFVFESSTGWVQEDSVVKVTYDIKEGDNSDGNGWDYRYPYVTITLKNKTMKTIYIDLGQCFLVKGEESYAYYVPGETHTTTGTSSGVGVNMGSVAGAMGIGGSVGALAGGVNVGGGRSSATTNITYTQRIIAVPPMSAKVLPKKPLVSYLRDSGNGIIVKDFGGAIWVGNVNTAKNPNLYLFNSNIQPMDVGSHIEYSAETSPVILHTFVAYSLTENCAQTTTLFQTSFIRYIIGVKNNKRLERGGNNAKYEEELRQYVPSIDRLRDIQVFGGKKMM